MSERSTSSNNNILIPGYQIIHKISQGKTGSIFRAIQLSVQREVALKVLPQQFSKNNEDTNNFLREAQIASSLQHPNVVSCFDAGTTDKNCWLAMELLEGGSLADLLANNGGALDDETVINIGLGCAFGLEAIHSIALTHRSINPTNIILSSDGQAKLTDLGSSASVYYSRGDTPHYLHDELPYVAPEILDTHNVQISSDIYSLGAVLFHCCTGSIPQVWASNDVDDFEVEDYFADDPRALNPDCSAALAAIIRKAMHQDVSMRYESPTRMREDLERLSMGFSLLYARSSTETNRHSEDGNLKTETTKRVRTVDSGERSGTRTVTHPAHHKQNETGTQTHSANEIRHESTTKRHRRQARQEVSQKALERKKAYRNAQIEKKATTSQKLTKALLILISCTIGIAVILSIFTSNTGATNHQEIAKTSTKNIFPSKVKEEKDIERTDNNLQTVSKKNSQQIRFSSTSIPRPAWASAFNEDAYGPWAELNIRHQKIRMRYCFPGTFHMGSLSDDPLQRDDEERHLVTLTNGFWMSEYEITQGLYKSVMDLNPAHFKGDNLPVESVTWNDAQQFCSFMSSTLKTPVRLPTEAEWEFAARAGNDGPLENISKFAWHRENSERKSQEIGLLQANAWGFYDLFGNVMEWTADTYQPYGKQHLHDPHFQEGIHRVVRGGSWTSPKEEIRAATRKPYQPTTKFFFIGFRIVIDE